jgi:hypothetical protein
MIEDYRFTMRDPSAAILPVALKYNILTEYTRYFCASAHDSLPLVVLVAHQIA